MQNFPAREIPTQKRETTIYKMKLCAKLRYLSLRVFFGWGVLKLTELPVFPWNQKIVKDGQVLKMFIIWSRNQNARIEC